MRQICGAGILVRDDAYHTGDVLHPLGEDDVALMKAYKWQKVPYPDMEPDTAETVSGVAARLVQ
ncbi:hypothetical protein V7S43_014728 [Phytophthora oleae]|uniref:Uncharacterized protein n=1 Tax=Phytophthora oleae TaxID=2107226 RepID=A0ABD3F056_9STRA